MTAGERGYNASNVAKLKTFSLFGIDALPVEVEVDVSPAGLPKTALVGLPEAAVTESNGPRGWLREAAYPDGLRALTSPPCVHGEVR